jgi:hypothetical protein
MDDEQLIRQFMLSAREDVSDSGFSARVMRHIPTMRPLWVFPVATLLVVAALAALFIWFDGWSVICSLFVRLYTAFTYAKHFSPNPIYLLVFLGLGCWYLTEKIKKLVY